MQVSQYAVAKLPSFLEHMISTTYAHFSRSSLRRDAFQSLHLAMCGKRALQFRRIVPTRWLCLGDALIIVLEQWDPLAAYFQAEATKGGPDVQNMRQMAELFCPKNKVLLTFISERLNTLNELNRVFQTEQPNQSSLLNHLMSYFFSLLDDVLTQSGVNLVRGTADPFKVDLNLYRKPLTAMHFG